MTASRGSRHSVVTSWEGGLRFSTSVRQHTVWVDQPSRAGGSDTAPTPLELLSVSLASCIALYAQRFCEERGLEAEGMSVEVKPVWREDPGRISRFDVTLHVPESVPARYREALEEVARGCPVHHTLTLAPEINVQLQSTTPHELAAV
jgi:putative redox protein